MPAPTRRLMVQVAAAAVASGCAPPRPLLANLAQPLEPPADGPIETAFDQAARMTAPVRLDGQGPFDFVVDTGANVSAISVELAQALALPPAGAATVHGIAGAHPAELVHIRRLEVGAVVAERLRAPALPRRRLGVDGLLGMDVLRGRRLVLEYSAGRFRVTPSAPSRPPAASRLGRPADPDAFEVPARFRFGQLVIVDAAMGGVRLLAFLDSGSQSTVGNLALLWAISSRTEGFAERLITATLLSATGQTIEARVAAAPPIRLGGLTIGDVRTAFADLHVFSLWGLAERPAILIGVDVLKHFRSVEIDYGARRVRLRPPSAPASGP